MSIESAKRDSNYEATDDEFSADVLGDTQLGESLGQLINEIKRDEASLRERAGSAEGAAGDFSEPDPFDPNEFTLDGPFESAEAGLARPPFAAGPRAVDEPAGEVESDEIADEVAGDGPQSTVAQAVSEIEAALQRFAQAERDRAEQLVAEKEAKVKEQYERLKILADKVARQKMEIQRAKQELREKLEVADRLHMEFDGIRRVLDGQIGVLESLDQDDDEDTELTS